MTCANIASINSALNTAGVGRAQVDTVAKAQALVDAYSQGADMRPTRWTTTRLKPLLADYAAMGITGVDSALQRSASWAT